jgi:hypothetical protein
MAGTIDDFLNDPLLGTDTTTADTGSGSGFGLGDLASGAVGWLNDLLPIATAGVGVYGAVTQADAQRRLQQAQTDIARMQAQSQTATSQSFAKWLPLIIAGGAVLVLGLILVLRKK